MHHFKTGGYCANCLKTKDECDCLKQQLIRDVKASMTQSAMLDEVPPKPNKITWRMLSEGESMCKKVKVIHHSTSSVIQLRIGGDEGLTTDVWFDYAEWENFIQFIKDIS